MLKIYFCLPENFLDGPGQRRVRITRGRRMLVWWMRSVATTSIYSKKERNTFSCLERRTRNETL